MKGNPNVAEFQQSDSGENPDNLEFGLGQSHDL